MKATARIGHSLRRADRRGTGPPLPERLSGSNESGQHFADLRPRSARSDDWITRCEGAEFLLVIGFDDTETPRPAAVEYRANDHHMTGVDQRLPVGGMAGHDPALFVGHVEGKRGTRSLEPEAECAHVSDSMECPEGLLASADTTDARPRVATYLGDEVGGRTIELDADPDCRPERQLGVGDLSFKSNAGRVTDRGNIDRNVTAHERVRRGVIERDADTEHRDVDDPAPGGELPLNLADPIPAGRLTWYSTTELHVLDPPPRQISAGSRDS